MSERYVLIQENPRSNYEEMTRLFKSVAARENIMFMFRGKSSMYVPEKICKVEWRHIGGDVAAGYCECGLELDRCHDYEPAHLPNFCPRCGRKVVG